MKVLIDTNVYLDFYRSHNESLAILDELKKIKSSLIFVDQIRNEFLRNRVKIIKMVIKSVADSNKSSLFTSALINESPELTQIKSKQDEIKDLSKLLTQGLTDILNDTQKDKIFCTFEELYRDIAVTNYEASESAYLKALKRRDLGAPPGTDPVTVGDQLIWETLLENLKENLILVTRDKTYIENEWILKQEFKDKTKHELVLITNRVTDAIKEATHHLSTELSKLEDEQLKAILLIPKEFEIVKIDGDMALVKNGNIFGMTPIRNHHHSFCCPTCGSYGPWNGVMCLTCGHKSDGD